jgi:hypothetical protein
MTDEENIENQKPRVGWTIWETIGIGIIDDRTFIDWAVRRGLVKDKKHDVCSVCQMPIILGFLEEHLKYNHKEDTKVFMERENDV